MALLLSPRFLRRGLGRVARRRRRAHRLEPHRRARVRIGVEPSLGSLRRQHPGAVHWLDDATGGKRTLYLGQQMTDPNGEWLLEFWNPLRAAVWSLDGTAPGPGPTLTPGSGLPNGALCSTTLDYPYVVEERGMDVVGKVVATHDHVAGGSLQNWRLVRIAPPLRLRDFVTGQYADGWSGADSAYTRFSSGETQRPGCASSCRGRGAARTSSGT